MTTVLIYLAGYLASYVVGRYQIKGETKTYMLSDRIFMLVFSLGSWFTFIVILTSFLPSFLLSLSSKCSERFRDRPVKW
jgi:hypothetical protein